MSSYKLEGGARRNACLPGDFLFIGGSDLFNPLNQPSQHMPYHLAPHLERLDVAGYVRFYDGPPATAGQRLKQGLHNVISHRINIRTDGHIRTIAARRLRLPGALDPLVQDLWLYSILAPHLKRRYEAAVVDGPESALMAVLLKKTGRVRYLIYYDIDFYPAVTPRWAAILSMREKTGCRTADAVASVSRPLAALREQQGAKIAVVIPNGVDFGRFNTANLDRAGSPAHARICGQPGRALGRRSGDSGHAVASAADSGYPAAHRRSRAR